MPKWTIYGGYHQVKLAEDSSQITAIITPWGVHRFLACPFGISTAPGEHQARIANEILKILKWCYRLY